MGFKQQILDKGYAILDGKQYLNFIDTENMEFSWKGPDAVEATPVGDYENIREKLKIMHQQIAEEYLAPHVKSWEFRSNLIWEGVGKNATVWHSDFKETANIFFLLYFNDLTEKDDGAFWIKNDREELRIVPKPGTMIAVENTHPTWKHRVEPTTQRRVVASFSYFVEWL